MAAVESGKVKILPWNGANFPTTCYITQNQAEQFKLIQYSSIQINFGVVKVSANLKVIPEETSAEVGKLYLSKDILRTLHLPQNGKFGLIINNNRLSFGPLIGVFVSGLESKKLGQGISKNAKYYTYTRVCKRLRGICYFFGINDIDWEHRLVRGWILNDNPKKGKRWVLKTLPFPMVIYDRCFGTNAQRDGYLLRARLKNVPGSVVFNAMPKLRKWPTYQLFIKNPKLAPHVPKTSTYLTGEDLTKALMRLDRVYLKPNSLSKGHGVFRVAGNFKGLVVEHRGPRGNEVNQLRTPEQLNKLLAPFIKRGRGYLFQQEIPLAKYKGNPFDMRVLCQKDITGKWTIAGIAVRIAASGSIITSPRSGGSVTSWPNALQTVFNQQEDTPNGVAARVTKVALEVCHTIEKHYGLCGELGLDIGVDHSGNVWIIEVNGKPLKVSLERLNSPELTENIYANPIKFACALANRQILGMN